MTLSLPVPQPKKRPALLSKREKQAAVKTTDRSENAEVRKRSGGRCEVVYIERWRCEPDTLRCKRRAVHIHHRISGLGRRNVGASILAENKWHLCAGCHSEIHGHVLIPDGKYFRRVQ